MKSLKDLIKKKLEMGDMMPEKKKMAMDNVLKELDDISDQGMAGKMSKVTVASDSPEGLKEGLEVAEDKVEELSEDDDKQLEDLDSMAEDAKMDEREDYMAESSDSDEDYDSMSEDELEKKIKELEEMKAKMMS